MAYSAAASSSTLRVHFAEMTRPQVDERKLLRSPPPKPARRPLLSRLSSSGASFTLKAAKNTKDARGARTIRVVEDSARRVPCDWVPIPGFKPFDYTLLELEVAQQREDIARRAFL